MIGRRELPEINASSMADIAFLLLIFFLVTTTIDIDKGILVRLPEWQETPPPITPRNKHNILMIHINRFNQLLINDDETDLDQLQNITTSFIDNNREGQCSYCNGKRDKSKSDHPIKAIISLQSDRATSYNTYIDVYDRIRAAYSQLREDVSQEIYDMSYIELNSVQKKTIKTKYPIVISESEPKKSYP